jgi:PIN domain
VAGGRAPCWRPGSDPCWPVAGMAACPGVIPARGAHRGNQAKWTDQILDETLRALRRNRSDITEEKAAGLRELINGSVRDCLVTGYQPLIEVLDLPDPDDRHFLAAAIKAGAQLIVTRNLKDFPAKTLAQWDIRHGLRLAGRLGLRPADRRFTHQTPGHG